MSAIHDNHGSGAPPFRSVYEEVFLLGGFSHSSDRSGVDAYDADNVSHRHNISESDIDKCLSPTRHSVSVLSVW